MEEVHLDYILIVEDDRALCSGIALALQSEQVQTVGCHSLAEARRILAAQPVSLLVLDVNLGDGSGLDLLREIREKGPDVPVVLLTANDLETDVVTGLELGADDYVTKPFSLMVLRARIRAQLRKRSGQNRVRIDDFSFDFETMEFSRDGKPVELSKTEQRLLRLLVEGRGRTLPRELLLERLWPDGPAYVEENALSVTVRRLREKLEADPSRPQYLKTVYGVGYTWVVK